MINLPQQIQTIVPDPFRPDFALRIFLGQQIVAGTLAIRTRLKTSPQTSRMGRLISILRLYFQTRPKDAFENKAVE